MSKPVALFNPESKRLHHPSRECGHFTPFVEHIAIESWTNEFGKKVREIGKPCRSCMKQLNFTIPPLEQENAT